MYIKLLAAAVVVTLVAGMPIDNSDQTDKSSNVSVSVTVSKTPKNTKAAVSFIWIILIVFLASILIGYMCCCFTCGPWAICAWVATYLCYDLCCNCFLTV